MWLPRIYGDLLGDVYVCWLCDSLTYVPLLGRLDPHWWHRLLITFIGYTWVDHRLCGYLQVHDISDVVLWLSLMWVSRLSWLLHVLYVPKILGWDHRSHFSHRIIHSRYPADCVTIQRWSLEEALIRGLSVPWPDSTRIFSVCVLIVSFDIMEEINRRAFVLLVILLLTFYWLSDSYCYYRYIDRDIYSQK